MPDNRNLQSFSNHAKYGPLFHFVAVPILAANFVWSAYQTIVRPGWATAFAALVAAALLITLFLARVFALKVQDRVIRLEMRLRMRELLQADLQPRIAEFTPAQLVALRFAGDRELPALARRVLDEKVQERKAIKQMITDWQADHFRA